MPLTDAITDYVNHITHERRLSKSTTVTQYASTNLRQLLRWLEANGRGEPALDNVPEQITKLLSHQARKEQAIVMRAHKRNGIT